MEQQYGDLTEYMTFPQPPAVEMLASGHRNHYESMVMEGHHHHHHQMGFQDYDNFGCDNSMATTTSTVNNGLEMMELGGSDGNGRWPREETLTLLDIRSRLDLKFKEANQKAPLWDEVSRMMSEEHGYKRSGKKCREKFENLYKYYKKTKEGKAGRQDGKHYRFFRQLEALYASTNNTNSSLPEIPQTHNILQNNFTPTNNNNDTNNNNNVSKLSESCSLTSSTGFDSSSSEDEEDKETTEKRRKRRGGSWRGKVRNFIDKQMRKIMEKQEDWLEKMTETLEKREQERVFREEEWRRQEGERIDREERFWANERAWIHSRDVALMEAFQKLTGKELIMKEKDGKMEMVAEQGIKGGDIWPDCEIIRLIQLRTGMESSIQQGYYSEDVLWEEIASNMAYLGYHRSAVMCRNKWNSIANTRKAYNNINNNDNKQRNNPRSYIQNNIGVQLDHGSCAYGEAIIDQQSLETRSVGARNFMNDSTSFRVLLGDGQSCWENYGVDLTKGGNHLT